MSFRFFNMNRCLASLIFLFLVGFLPAARLHGAQLDAYLITLGSNDQLYTGAGHTLLRIIDYERGTDKVYNWGTFNFHAKNFALKFYQRTLMYKLTVNDASWYLSIQKSNHDRSLVQNRIRLTSEQQKTLRQRIDWWSEQDHRLYQYHSFKKNCSTVIRDILDETLGNQLSAKTTKQVMDLTYRQAWWSHFSHFPFIALAADMHFNAKIDQPISVWQSLFLPSQLKKVLEELGYLEDDQILIDLPYLQSPGNDAGLVIAIAFGLLLTLAGAGLSFTKAKLYPSKLLGFLCLLWGLMAGLLGTLFLVTSWISEREYFHAPASTLLFWPIDFVFVALGLAIITQKKWPEKSKKEIWIKAILASHLVSSACFLILKSTPILAEPLLTKTLWFCLLGFGLYPLLWRHAFCRQEAGKKHHKLSKKTKAKKQSRKLESA